MPEPADQPEPPDVVAPAGLAERGIAWVIDFIFLLLLFAFTSVLPMPFEWNFGLALVIGLTYSAMEFIGAGTMGKVVIDLKIANRDGTQADGRRKLIRWCLRNPAALLLLLTFGAWHFTRQVGAGTRPLWIWELLWIASCTLQSAAILGCLLAILPGQRSLQDRLTGTAVLRRDKVRVGGSGRGFTPVFRPGPS